MEFVEAKKYKVCSVYEVYLSILGISLEILKRYLKLIELTDTDGACFDKA